MELTPPQDSKPYNHSSTPLTHLHCARKRKHDETFDSTPPSPKFSSTFNESLISNFKEFHLIDCSLPNTPEKQLKILNKNVVTASPIQESRKILYSSIKVVKPEKRFLSRVNKFVSHDSRNLLEKILNINVIMDVVFKYLSGGDLFRFSLVSHSFLKALQKNSSAFNRYKRYKEVFRDNKENYVITPPGSPEKCDSPPRTSSENLNIYLRIAKKLSASQTLTKCRKCNYVAIVENDICQCQNITFCGLIYCLRCASSSETGPANFKDLCGHATLRPKLGNMSNTMNDSFFNFSHQDSGFYSENETPPKVKRNLFSTSTENSRVLSVCNKNKIVLTQKKREQLSFVKVETNKDQVKKPLDCDSPPRYGYAAGSKQSKRNLKRLTR